MRIAILFLLIVTSLASCRPETPCRPEDPGCTIFSTLMLYVYPRYTAAKYLYVSNSANQVVSFSISQTTGLLNQVGTLATPGAASQPIVDPLGRYVAVSAFGSNTVSFYRIGSDGSLTLFFPVTTGAAPGLTAPDVFGRFFFAAIGAPGTSIQTLIPGATSVVISSNVTIGQPQTPAQNSAGTMLFATGNATPAVYAYLVQADGNLVFVNTASFAGAGNKTTVDPTGRFVFLTTNTPSIYSFATHNDGSLTSVNNLATGAGPGRAYVEPLGRFVYVANGTSNDVSMYSVASTGTLTSLGAAIPAGTFPNGIIADSQGRFLYVTNNTSGDISIYSIASSGLLTLINTQPLGASAQELFFDRRVGMLMQPVTGAASLFF